MATIQSKDEPVAHPISAAILAGGASRRMGEDKALLDWNGRPLIVHVAERVRALGDLVDDVMVVGGRPAHAVPSGALVPDDFPGTGALGGVATALRAARQDHVLIVACDMPLLNVDLLRAMIALTSTCDGVIVPVLDADRSDQGGRQTFETLHAIYPTECLPVITARLEAGNLKIADALQALPVCRLDEAWIRTYDPELMSFLNVNTPEQFASAQGYYRRAIEGRREEQSGG